MYAGELPDPSLLRTAVPLVESVRSPFDPSDLIFAPTELSVTSIAKKDCEGSHARLGSARNCQMIGPPLEGRVSPVAGDCSWIWL